MKANTAYLDSIACPPCADDGNLTLIGIHERAILEFYRNGIKLKCPACGWCYPFWGLDMMKKARKMMWISVRLEQSDRLFKLKLLRPPHPLDVYNCGVRNQ